MSKSYVGGGGVELGEQSCLLGYNFHIPTGASPAGLLEYFGVIPKRSRSAVRTALGLIAISPACDLLTKRTPYSGPRWLPFAAPGCAPDPVAQARSSAYVTWPFRLRNACAPRIPSAACNSRRACVANPSASRRVCSRVASLQCSAERNRPVELSLHLKPRKCT